MIKKRDFICKLFFLAAAITAFLFGSSCKSDQKEVVKIGLLHSTTGSMAFSENSVLNAELMAIQEINEAGGVLGCKIEAIQENGNSDFRDFADKARKLVEKDQVASIFGCWTSDSRKAVKNIVEEYYNLLWYPVQYEGMEASPNIMYMGACPNQQVVPAIDFCFEQLGKKFYLIGSDYVFPQIANKIIKAQLKELGGEVVGETYVDMDEDRFQFIIKEIQDLKPDVIINTLNGHSNISFFIQFHNAGLDAQSFPIMSFSIAENEINEIGPEFLEGHYVACNYFESLDSSVNKKFVEKYKELYGDNKHVGDSMEAGYLAIYLWAAACEKAGSFDIEAVRIASKNLSQIEPEGYVTIEGSNQHLNKVVRVGKINSIGQIKEIWSTKNPIRPDPYLSTYTWARGL